MHGRILFFLYWNRRVRFEMYNMLMAFTRVLYYFPRKLTYTVEIKFWVLYKESLLNILWALPTWNQNSQNKMNCRGGKENK